jgi:hypothetical protein
LTRIETSDCIREALLRSEPTTRHADGSPGLAPTSCIFKISRGFPNWRQKELTKPSSLARPPTLPFTPLPLRLLSYKFQSLHFEDHRKVDNNNDYILEVHAITSILPSRSKSSSSTSNTPTLTPPAETSPMQGLEDINGVKWY